MNQCQPCGCVLDASHEILFQVLFENRFRATGPNSVGVRTIHPWQQHKFPSWQMLRPMAAYKPIWVYRMYRRGQIIVFILISTEKLNIFIHWTIASASVISRDYFFNLKLRNDDIKRWWDIYIYYIYVYIYVYIYWDQLWQRHISYLFPSHWAF